MRLIRAGLRHLPDLPERHSLWITEVSDDELHATSIADHNEGGVVIVGGGFVGLWTAIQIRQLDPTVQVTVLEAGRCGYGASGLNGGFVMSWWPKIASLVRACGVDDAIWLARQTTEAVEQLPVFLRQHDIDAELRMAGWLWTATAPAHTAAWAPVLATLERLGIDGVFSRVLPEDLARRTGSTAHIAGVHEAVNGTVHPGKLARGLARTAVGMGVRIVENAPVLDISMSRPVVLKTPDTRFVADRVVIATNAWSALVPELKRRFVCVGSAVMATPPIPNRLQEIGWTGGESITDSQSTVTYYRTTQSGRIVFGKGGGRLYYTGAPAGVVFDDQRGISEAIADFRRVYPSLSDVPIDASWSGPIDRTYDSLPLIGTIAEAEHISYGVGWSGNGVNPSRVGGRILAGLALGRKDRWTTNGLVNRKARSFPPEPFRYLGGGLVRAAVMNKDRAEISNVTPSFFTRALASLAPAGLEDKV